MTPASGSAAGPVRTTAGPVRTTAGRVRPRLEVLLVLALLALVSGSAGGDARAVGWDNGLAATPPMGFNNWNATQCGPAFSASTVEATADRLVATGLRDSGYRFVNLDDCWALPARDATGRLVPDPQRFPDGIAGVAAYVHARGLELGIYSSAGTRTCSAVGFPGSLGHEVSDARQFAAWGVDYLKYDNCNNDGVDARQRYTTMRDALAATHRPIVYSVCEWGESAPWEWAGGVGNSWRTTADVTDDWASVVSNFRHNVGLAAAAGPGHWNDPDLLEVGNGGLTPVEDRSQFTLWAMMNAPLLISTDLSAATPDVYRVVGNRAVIALDQDPLGRQAVQVTDSGGAHVLVKPLANGDRAVALFNDTEKPMRIGTDLAAADLPAGPHRLRDLWSGDTVPTSGAIAALVAPHATVVYRVTRA